ncbi:MAG: hypothetical protein A2521_03160 [Deltaproteobacteria bacterium RIFOXYD12_FULL_57_12]|nr:MAG: hypothetical protein A2521_03160 [Deltaproteobacteria bacterium RIFOXYD12_FULL_57_12]
MTPRINKFDTTMAAATYAEAGEHEYARQLLHEERPEARKRVGRLQRIFAAVAFAEAGEYETAREIMREEERPVARVQPRQELRA